MQHGISSENLMRQERSPYLLQHAHQPIWWQPWGDQAFERAQAEQKLIFLSIGYAACHWCHVMAHETFEDQAVADLLNARYIAIKVDRQERPDVDAVYMTLCEAMTGSGGWPLSVILTPSREPLFAGSYFPPHTGMHGQGLTEILTALDEVWRRDGALCSQQAQRVVNAVAQATGGTESAPSLGLIEAVHDTLSASYDLEFAGFGRMPKFPRPCALLLLLREAQAQRDNAWPMAQATLARMARGGIHDIIGGGFMRYAMDRKWQAPHYEKMLYDNALLALAYLSAYQQSGLERYADVTRHIFDWAFREMRLPDGGFASAQDADSAEGEGAFYQWTPEQIHAVLGEARGEAACAYLNIKANQSLPHIALRARAPEDVAELLDLLRQARADRPAPALDDQMLTAWNAWMITALAQASTVLDRPDYLAQAMRTAQCIQTRLTAPDGRLYVSYRDGKASGDGTLAEYAAWCLALCALYDATWDVAWLELAALTARQMTARFGDPDGGGLYQVAQNGETLVLRLKPTSDEALPAPNAVAAYALAHLADLGAHDLRPWADRSLRYISGAIRQQPYGHDFAALALTRALWPYARLIVAPGADFDLAALRAVLRTRSSLSVLFAGDQAPSFARDGMGDYTARNGKTTYYICIGQRCLDPATSLEALVTRLEAVCPA